MLDERVEFLISQYQDGTLPEGERAALEGILAEDGEARALLEEYRELDRSMKEIGGVPAVDWGKLAGEISAAIDRKAEEEVRERYSISAWRGWGRMAMAASVLLMIGVGAVMYLNRDERKAVNEVVAKVEVKVLHGKKTSGRMVAEVAIGPSRLASQNMGTWGDLDGVVTRPSGISIASEGGKGVEEGFLPY